MKICPSCQLEYEDQAEHCSECEVELLDQEIYQQARQESLNGQIELKKVYEANNNMELDVIISLLEANGLPTTVKRRGSGDYLNIAYGFNYQGAEVYVDQSDYHLAVDILQARPVEVEAIDVKQDLRSDFLDSRDAQITSEVTQETLNETVKETSQSMESDQLSDQDYLRRRRLYIRVILLLTFGLPLLIGLIQWLMTR